MSFFSNFQSDKCPCSMTGNPLNGLTEKVCIQAEKIFDAGIKQTQVPNYSLTLTDLDPADLRMNEYSVNYVTENGERAATAEITFTARESLFRKYTFHVICHQENGAWRVCDECSYITASGVGKYAPVIK